MPGTHHYAKTVPAKGLLEGNAHGMSCAAHYLAAMMSFLAACHLWLALRLITREGASPPAG